MPTLPVLATLAVAALVTSFISGILGMAGGMILMGVLLALLTVPQAMVLHGVTQLAANGWRAVLWRREIDWRGFRGNAGGAPAGLALPEKLVLDVRKRGHPFLCGVVCTGLQLIAGVSGPILDVFFVRSKMDRRAVVATKASIQSLGHVIKIAYFGGLVAAAQRGTVDPRLALLMVALAIAGTSLSRRVLERLSDASFRQWTRWAVMTMGIAYLATGAWMLAR